MGITSVSKMSNVRDTETSNYNAANFRMHGDPSVDHESEVKVFNALVKFLSKPERWTKGASARLGGGKSWPVVNDPDVVCWCIVGAMDYIKSKNYHALTAHLDRVYNGLNDVARKMGFAYLEDFNDDERVKHEHMMKFLEKSGKILRYTI